MQHKFRNILVCLLFTFNALAQSSNKIDSFRIHGDIKITIDQPSTMIKKNQTIVCFFALPNGNTTDQTMGKLLQPGEDWHFDIQHIRAQTAFIRSQLITSNFIVIYLENNLKSWPAWKQHYADFKTTIPHLVDSLVKLFGKKNLSIYLNGHSGGGSFIFGYLAGVDKIPGTIKRISFLDSDYGYDSSYYPKFRDWLSSNKEANLNVFAYNDSVALYNGKPLVSPTGGTWYRSHLLLTHLRSEFTFAHDIILDSLSICKSTDNRIQFFFKANLNHGIYHTQQVELNGFIHSILCGTPFDSKKYGYYEQRAYTEFIHP